MKRFIGKYYNYFLAAVALIFIAATATTIYFQPLLQIVTLEEFGGKADSGVTDNGAAFALALAALPNGGIVHLGPGHYGFTATQTIGSIGAYGLIIHGAGIRSTYIDCPFDGKGLNVTPTTGYQYGLTLRDFTLSGPKDHSISYTATVLGTSSTAATPNSVGIYAYNLQAPWDFSRIYVSGFSTGVFLDSYAHGGSLYNCDLAYNDYGFNFSGSNGDTNRLINCSLGQNSIAQGVISSSRTQILQTLISYDATTIANPAVMGLWLKNQNGHDALDCTISLCKFEAAYGGGGNITSPFIQIGLPGETTLYEQFRILDNTFAIDPGATMNTLNPIYVCGGSRNAAIKGNIFALQLSTLSPYGFDNSVASGLITNIEFDQEQKTNQLSVLGNGDLSKVLASGRMDNIRDIWQSLPNFGTLGWTASVSGLAVVDDAVPSWSGANDAYSLSVTAASGIRGMYWSVTGDNSVWDIRVNAEGYGATPLHQFSFFIQDPTDANYLSRAVPQLEQYWKEYRVSAYLVSGKTYYIGLSGWPGTGSVTGSMAFTKPMVRKNSLSGTLLFSPSGILNTLTANALWPYSLPLGAVAWKSGAAVAANSFATVIARLDTTLLAAPAIGDKTITVVSNAGVAAGDMIRLGQTLSNGQVKMVYNTTTGYHVVSTGGSTPNYTITFTEALEAGGTYTIGNAVQVLRYGYGGTLSASP